MKILNLFAGIGGNRNLWGNSHEITAVENDEATAAEYQNKYPNDIVIVGDAHEYLLKNYMSYDFIWSSPPCPTHSIIRMCGVFKGQYSAEYIDMVLYQEIILLKKFAPKETFFVVENVRPYYEPLISADVKLHRHLFWCNFKITKFDITNHRRHMAINPNSIIYDFDLSQSKIKDKRKALRNLLDPELGLHILNCALNIKPEKKTKQLDLFDIDENVCNCVI